MGASGLPGRQPLDMESASPRDAHYFVAPSASIQERQPRALKSGDTFALFDVHGDALGAMHGPEGIYYRDTRHLSYWRLTVCGSYPMLLASAIDDRIDALIVDLSNPDIEVDGEVAIPNESIHINRTKFLHDGCAHERIVVRNFNDRRHRLKLEMTLGADFHDMFEVRGERRAQRGVKLPGEQGQAMVVHRYRGLDRVQRETALSFSPTPKVAREHRIEFEIDLGPGERTTLFCLLTFDARPREEPARAFLKAYRSLHRLHRETRNDAPRISSSNAMFDAMIARAVADVSTLTTFTPEGPCVYAGIPWYCTLFGRDSIVTALELLWYDPLLARGTLRRLAALQATADDPHADAEPGKIMHEMRLGEMANLGEVPFALYYGSIDATPLFVYLAGEYLRRSSDLATIEALWPALTAALTWIDLHGDRDGDGFLEYGARSGQGLRNQGWKDSHDAISHADGRLAEGTIALVEVQAYAYGAWRAAAAMCEQRGDMAASKEWTARADDMRRRFDERFFDVDLGSYILALDGEKQPCRVIASNAGHALLTGIALPDRAQAVARRLMAPDCFSGWGIRTLSQYEKRYNPMSYHNGSVWPHDNALIAAGFARYGLQAEVNRVFTGLFDAANYFDQHRFPELFCGFTRRGGRGPTLYPVACAPQAWSSAAPLYLMKAMLGLELDSCRNIRFEAPHLPGFLSTLTLNAVRCNDDRADLDIQQLGQATSVFVKRRTGDISVTVTN